jgi:hypothetical protein
VRVVVTASNSVGSTPAASREVGPIAPSAAQIKASLLRQITPHGKAAKIGALLKKHGYVLSFTALSGGTAEIDWYYVPDGTQLASGRPTPVLLAVGKATFSAAATVKITIKLTANGTRLLQHANSSSVRGRYRFSSRSRLTPPPRRPLLGEESVGRRSC